MVSSSASASPGYTRCEGRVGALEPGSGAGCNGFGLPGGLDGGGGDGRLRPHAATAAAAMRHKLTIHLTLRTYTMVYGPRHGAERQRAAHHPVIPGLRRRGARGGERAVRT